MSVSLPVDIAYHFIRYSDKFIPGVKSPIDRLAFNIDTCSDDISLNAIKYAKRFSVFYMNSKKSHIEVFCLSLTSLYNHLRFVGLRDVKYLASRGIMRDNKDMIEWQIQQEEKIGCKIAKAISEFLKSKFKNNPTHISFGDSHGDAVVFRTGIELYYSLKAETVCLGDILAARDDKWFGNMHKEYIKNADGKEFVCPQFALLRDLRDVKAMEMLNEVMIASKRMPNRFIILKGNHDNDKRIEELHATYGSPLTYIHDVFYVSASSQIQLVFQHAYIPKKHASDVRLKRRTATSIMYEAPIDHISYFHSRYRKDKPNCDEELAGDVELRTRALIMSQKSSLVVMGHEANALSMAANIETETIIPMKKADTQTRFKEPLNLHEITPFGESLFQCTLPLDGMDGNPDWTKLSILFQFKTSELQ